MDLVMNDKTTFEMSDSEISDLATKYGYWNENAAWEFQPWELESFVKDIIDTLLNKVK